MLAAGRRTYLPMSVLAGMLGVTFVVYILLYRKLSPSRPPTGGADSSDSREEVVSMHFMVSGNCEAEELEEEEETREEGEEKGEQEEREEERGENQNGLEEEYDISMNDEDTLLWSCVISVSSGRTCICGALVMARYYNNN